MLHSAVVVVFSGGTNVGSGTPPPSATSVMSVVFHPHVYARTYARARRLLDNGSCGVVNGYILREKTTDFADDADGRYGRCGVSPLSFSRALVTIYRPVRR